MDLKIEQVFFDGRARLFPYSQYVDNRGQLIPFNFDDLPFLPRRSFIISDVSAGTTRGQHGHKEGMQLLVCLQGSIEIMMRYQGKEINLLLNPLSPSLIFGSGVWCQQTYIEDKSILLVFSSEPYNQDSYIEQWT